MTRLLARLVALALLAVLLVPVGAQQQKPFKIPPANLKEQIIWGSTCEGPDGFVLAFGGQDQKSDDLPRTRIKVKGEWQSLSEELRKKNPLQEYCDQVRSIARQQKEFLARARHIYFQGLTKEQQFAAVKAELVPHFAKLQKEMDKSHELSKKLLDENKKGAGAKLTAKQEAMLKLGSLTVEANHHVLPVSKQLSEGQLSKKDIMSIHKGQTLLEEVADSLDAEPAPRALSLIVYDARTKRFVLFGGDHLDYLTSDTWVFDPATKQWELGISIAPTARASHSLKAAGDGKVILTGGYTYTSSMSYVGAQYKELSDGDWTYDIAADTWSPDKGMPPDTRVYRTGPFHPDYFLQGAKPDAAASKKELDAIPANRWVERKAPHKPEMVRTWGHAVLDPDHDLVLVFSGGHSAHCGSDVLHYHLSTNRWELPFPVEFPLGQTYSNTSYPEGYNLNKRPWMTGHTYQSYNYDPLSKKLYLNARVNNTYVYDPVVGDWTGRFPKPKPMVYNDCFYTLNTLPTPHGLYCWTAHGGLFKLDSDKKEWQEVKRSGVKLPNAVVDASTYVYDSKRDRFLFIRSDYGKRNDGELHVFDIKSGEVSKKTPANAAALAALDLKGVDRAVYDPEHDLVLFSTLLPGEAGSVRRALAYDCAADKWVSLAIGYEIDKNKRAAHPGGPGHSCGLLFDAKRKLIWGIDTHDCRVYALKLEMDGADKKPLE